MEYRTKPTKHGNIGVSRVSFKSAKAQAKAMDESRNMYCENCTDCINCRGCIDCKHCVNCMNCDNCSYCEYCRGCDNCNHSVNCINCTDCEDSRDCKDCTDCLVCTYCLRCTNISSSQLVNGWKFGTATNVISLNGLYWPVTTDGIRIQIGCKNHTLREWETFTDNEIRNMSPRALSFWITHKDNILALAHTRKHCKLTKPRRMK